MTRIRAGAALAMAVLMTGVAGVGAGLGVGMDIGGGVARAQTIDAQTIDAQTIDAPTIDQAREREGRAGDRPSSITVRPWTLAAFADELAGQPVTLPRARVVRVIDPRVFIVESVTPLRSMIDHHRVAVFLESGTFETSPDWKDASLTIVGVARSLRGMQAARGAFWPASLTRDEVDRLHVRVAILARSVQTSEGIELIASGSAALFLRPAGTLQ